MTKYYGYNQSINNNITTINNNIKNEINQKIFFENSKYLLKKRNWFNSFGNNVDTTNFVLNPQLGGIYYDKYVKYKQKYLELKENMKGGDNIENNIKKLLVKQINIIVKILYDQECCEKKLQNYTEANKNNQELRIIYKAFNDMYKKNKTTWNSSISTKAPWDLDDKKNYGDWIIQIYHPKKSLKNILNDIWSVIVQIMNQYNLFIKEYLNKQNIVESKLTSKTTNIIENCSYDLPVDESKKKDLNENIDIKENVDICCVVDKKTYKCIYDTGKYFEDLKVVYNDIIREANGNQYKDIQESAVDKLNKIKIEKIINVLKMGEYNLISQVEKLKQ